MKRYQNLCVLPMEFDAVLVANGDPVPRALLRRVAARSRVIVALDGGINQLHRALVAPHLLLGDLDSTGGAALLWARKAGVRISKIADQTKSDFAKGLAWVHSQKCRDVAVISAYGSRPDHLLAALVALAEIKHARFIIVTAEHLMFSLNGRRKLALPLARGTVLSWQSLDKATGCTLSGVRWPFSNKILKSGGFTSLSNKVTDTAVFVSQSAGHSWLTVSLDP